MTLTKERINPLNVLGQRRLIFCPVHFVSITSTALQNQLNIDQWINERLAGRYFLLRRPHLTSSNQYTNILSIGFEDPKELTMLILGCPYIKEE